MYEVTPELRRQLAALEGMTLSQLRERFLEVVGEPTTSKSKQHLVKRLRWWLQLRAFREEERWERIKRRGLEIARLEDVRLTPPESRASPSGPPSKAPMARYRSLHLLLGIMGLVPCACLADPGPGQGQIGPWRTSVNRTAAAPSSPLAAGTIAPHRLAGLASYYWQGQRTASGEPFDRTALTAAHPTLPFNSLVRVTDRASGSSVVVRINDRGPFTPGRVIDLSEAAANMIDLTSRGLAPVDHEVLTMPERAARR